MNIYSHQNQFLDNKYTNWYYAIIIAAQSQNRKKNNGVYYENHHILPKCWYPQFSKEYWNQVLLTAREHWICHRLLTKITFGKLKQKMSFAVINLLGKNDKHIGRYKPHGRVYEYIKIELSTLTSGKNSSMYGIKRPKEHTEAARLAKIGKPRSEETRAKLRAANIGKLKPPRSDEYRANISKALKGKTFEEIHGPEKAAELKARIAETLRQRNRQV